MPLFYKEQGYATAIDEIKLQSEQNPEKSILLYIYNNGYNIGKQTTSDLNYTERNIGELLDHNTKPNLDHFILSNIYLSKPCLSVIRSDMFDSLILSKIAGAVGDDTVYLPIDADLRKIEEGYMRALFDQHNKGSKIVTGERNRSFEEEKNKDPLLFLQEKIFLLGEEEIYNKSTDNELSTITNGRSSSFNLKSLLLVKGYERTFESADDIILGHKLNRFYGNDKKNRDINSFIDKKIRADGSRGSEMIQAGRPIFKQWDPGTFDIKQGRETRKQSYEEQNLIITSLQEGKLVNEENIIWIESLIKSYIDCFFGKNDYLNKIFREKLIVLLHKFFGNHCKYSFSYEQRQKKIIFKVC